MGAIGVILLIAFVIICVLVILVVLIQNEEEGMGGLFGSRTSTAFGSHSASILTKTTFVLVTLFFLTSFALALINKKPAAQKDLSGVAAEVQQSSAGKESQSEWWKNSSETTTPAPEKTAPAASK